MNLVGCNQAKIDRFGSFGIEPPFGTRMSDAELAPEVVERVAYVEGLEAEVVASGVAVMGRQETETPPSGPERTIIRSTG